MHHVPFMKQKSSQVLSHVATGKPVNRWLTGSFDDLMSTKRVLPLKTDETRSLPALNDGFWKKRMSICIHYVLIKSFVSGVVSDKFTKAPLLRYMCVISCAIEHP